MKKYSLIQLLFLILIFFIRCDSDSNYVEFKYVEFEKKEERLKIIPHQLSPKEVLKVIIVLTYYNESFIVKNGNLYLNKDYYEDSEKMELVWNYSNKSRDNFWIQQNICTMK